MFWGLGFKVYNTLVNYSNKQVKNVTEHFLKCYEMLRVQVLGYNVQGLGLGVQVLGLTIYNTLVNYFNKHLNKSYKTLFEIL